jgi:hypothetical protein
MQVIRHFRTNKLRPLKLFSLKRLATRTIDAYHSQVYFIRSVREQTEYFIKLIRKYHLIDFPEIGLSLLIGVHTVTDMFTSQFEIVLSATFLFIQYIVHSLHQILSVALTAFTI